MKKLFIVGVLFLGLALVQAQDSVRVVAGLESYEALESESAGNLVQTTALVCTDKGVLESVLRLLEEQASLDVEPELPAELSAQVDEACFLDEAVELEFVALDSNPFSIRFPLTNTEFLQTSRVRIAEVIVKGYQLDKVHSLQGGSVVLQGAYREFNQSAYFAVLESVNVAKP